MQQVYGWTVCRHRSLRPLQGAYQIRLGSALLDHVNPVAAAVAAEQMPARQRMILEVFSTKTTANPFPFIMLHGAQPPRCAWHFS